MGPPSTSGGFTHFRSLLGIAIVILTLTIFSSIGDDSASAVDTSTRVQDIPGDLEYDIRLNRTIWSSDTQSEPSLKPRNHLMSANVDGVPGDELLFGTANGTLIVIDADRGVELVNHTVPGHYISQPYVGELDGDDSSEIVFSSHEHLYCYDFQDRKVQWQRRNLGYPCRLLDLDDDGRDEILTLSSGRFRLLDYKGVEIFNVSLDIFNDPLGYFGEPIVEDIDGDGDLEVFLVDRLRGWRWPAYGRHIWIIDLDSGVLVYSKKCDELIFQSDPVLIAWEETYHIAVGLDGDARKSSDLMLFDPTNMSYELYNFSIPDVNTSRDMYDLCLVPFEDGPFLIASVHHTYLYAWSFLDKETVWHRPLNHSLAARYSHAVTCDIDGDGEYEVLVPSGPLHIIDARTGTIESSIPFSKQSCSEHRMTLGDFDGDGVTEIVTGNKNWVYSQTYDIDLHDNRPIEIIIEWASDDDNVVLYAGLQHHLAIVIINVSLGSTTMIDISMWNEASGAFCFISIDPSEGMVTDSGDGTMNISNGSFAYHDTGLTIVLPITPSWTFSFEGLNDVVVNITRSKGGEHGKTFPDAFRVERDLVLGGTPASSWRQGLLSNGDWVLPQTSIETRGLDVVYEGTTDVHPPPDAFSLEVFDGLATMNITFEDSKAQIVGTQSPGTDGPFNISIRLVEIHKRSYGEGAYSISLNVDATPPVLLGLYPENGTWFSVEVIVIDMLIDDKGCGIDTDSIRFKMSGAGSGPGNEWEAIERYELSKEPIGWELFRSMKLGEGMTLLEWEVHDLLGQSLAFNMSIGVDLHGISFHDFTPVGWWNRGLNGIPVNVNVSDEGGSGINTSSIEWSYSHSDLLSFSDWVPAQLTEHQGIYSVHLNYTGVEGITNLIRFRGRDNAGNQALSSRVYVVQIDNWAPNVTLLTETAYLLDPEIESLKIMITDAISGVSERLMVTIFNIGADTGYIAEVTIVESSKHSMTVDLKIEDRMGIEYRLEVECWDVAGNRKGHSRWFDLDQPPAITRMSPEEGASFVEGTAIEFSVTWEDPNGGGNSVEWWVGDTLLSRNATFNTSSLSVGEHYVSVNVKDFHHEVTRRVLIVVTEEPDEPEVPEPPDEPPDLKVEDDILDPLWLVVLIIAIIGIVSLVIAYRLRKDRSEESG